MGGARCWGLLGRLFFGLAGRWMGCVDRRRSPVGVGVVVSAV